MRRSCLPRFSTASAYTAPAMSASRPCGANTVPRSTRPSTVQVNVGSQPLARSHASACAPIGRSSPSMRSTGRMSGASALRPGNRRRPRTRAPRGRRDAAGRARGARRRPDGCTAGRANDCPSPATAHRGSGSEARNEHNARLYTVQCARYTSLSCFAIVRAAFAILCRRAIARRAGDARPERGCDRRAARRGARAHRQLVEQLLREPRLRAPQSANGYVQVRYTTLSAEFGIAPRLSLIAVAPEAGTLAATEWRSSFGFTRGLVREHVAQRDRRLRGRRENPMAARPRRVRAARTLPVCTCAARSRDRGGSPPARATILKCRSTWARAACGPRYTLGSQTDLMIGHIFWITAAGRYIAPQTATVPVLVHPPGMPLSNIYGVMDAQVSGGNSYDARGDAARGARPVFHGRLPVPISEQSRELIRGHEDGHDRGQSGGRRCRDAQCGKRRHGANALRDDHVLHRGELSRARRRLPDRDQLPARLDGERDGRDAAGRRSRTW